MGDITKEGGTGVVTVRLGGLRPQLESLCERMGIERSDYIRQAIEEKMQWTGLVDARALCLGAALGFKLLVASAKRAGLVNAAVAERLGETVADFAGELREQLDSLYKEKFPDAARIDEEDAKAWNQWKRAGAKGPEPRVRESSDGGHQWRARIETAQNDSFPDLDRANVYVRRTAGEEVDYAPQGSWIHPNEVKRDTKK